MECFPGVVILDMLGQTARLVPLGGSDVHLLVQAASATGTGLLIDPELADPARLAADPPDLALDHAWEVSPEEARVIRTLIPVSRWNASDIARHHSSCTEQ